MTKQIIITKYVAQTINFLLQDEVVTAEDIGKKIERDVKNDGEIRIADQKVLSSDGRFITYGPPTTGSMPGFLGIPKKIKIYGEIEADKNVDALKAAWAISALFGYAEAGLTPTMDDEVHVNLIRVTMRL